MCMKYLRIMLLLLVGAGVTTLGFGLPPKGLRESKALLRRPQSFRELLLPPIIRGIRQAPLRATIQQKGPSLPAWIFSPHTILASPPLRFNYPERISIPQLPQANSPLTLFSKQYTDAFIFDLDGTLLDSLGAWENSAVNYLRSRGIEPQPGLQEEMEELSLLDGARIIKERYHLNEPPEELVTATLQPIKERYYRDIPAKAQVPFLLDYLHRQGIKMAVATASHADFAHEALERLGILDYFEFIITCDEVGTGKRNPLIYEVAAARLGADKSRTVVVEDAFYALKTAHEAGFKTIGIADEHSANDFSKIQETADLFLNLE